MNVEDEDISALKRKNREADNIMLKNHDASHMQDDEGSQLMLNGGLPNGVTPGKAKGNGFDMDNSDDEDEPYSAKKRLLNESDFELNEKKQNIPTPDSL